MARAEVSKNEMEKNQSVREERGGTWGVKRAYC